MGLHDVDKNSDDRTSPVVNAHDLGPDRRMAHGTNSVNYQTAASPAFGAAQIQGGNSRLVGADVVRVIAPDGTTGVITITTTTYHHNLGYAPKAEAYLNNRQINNGGSYNIPLPLDISVGANTGGTGGAPEYLGVIRTMYYATDATSFYVITYSSGSALAGTYDVTFYLYQQTAST